MNNLKTQIKITIALSFLALLSGVMAHLALTDIYHNEPDVSLEWNLLRVNAGIFILFAAAALITLKRSLRFFPD